MAADNDFDHLKIIDFGFSQKFKSQFHGGNMLNVPYEITSIG